MEIVNQLLDIFRNPKGAGKLWAAIIMVGAGYVNTKYGTDIGFDAEAQSLATNITAALALIGVWSVPNKT